MDSKKDNVRTIISTTYWQYPQKANGLFPWVVISIAFLIFIVAFVTPTYLQAAYTFHFGTDVEIQGDYAYAAITGTSHSATDVIWMTPPPPELPSGLRVIDISDPDSPKIVGGLDYSNSGTLCIALEGDLAYLSYSGGEGVKIIDISNPEKPKVIGTIKNVYAREMVVRDSYAYLAIADPDLGLVIFDVSNPAAPAKAATLNLNGMVEDIALQGDFAYLPFDDDDYPKECGIHVCDISNPENPFLVDRFVVGTGADSDVPSGGRMRIWMNADYAYLAKESVIIIVDVSDPENLSRKEIWHLPGMPPYSHVPSTEKLAGSGEYIYVTGDVDSQEELLFVVDISNPLNPDLIGDVSIFRPNDIAVQGDYAYIVARDGFQIINISDPDNPSVAGKVESTHQNITYPIIGDIYGYRYGSPYLPGPYQSYPGFRYGYPLGGFGTSGGYGFGYPFNGFGTSGGYGYPYNPYGYQRPNFASDLWINPYGGIGGIGYPGYGSGYPLGGFRTPGGSGYGYPLGGFGIPGGYGYPLGGFGTSGGYGYPPGWRPLM